MTTPATPPMPERPGIGEMPPLLFRMVEDGRLGRKAGRGFFRHDGTAS
ncbi:hypothetical protein AB0F25_24645 [Streptomyces wedmorensis]